MREMRSIERNPRYCIENRLRPEGSLEIALYYIAFHIESIIAAPIQGANYYYIYRGLRSMLTHLSHLVITQNSKGGILGRNRNRERR